MPTVEDLLSWCTTVPFRSLSRRAAEKRGSTSVCLDLEKQKDLGFSPFLFCFFNSQDQQNAPGLSIVVPTSRTCPNNIMWSPCSSLQKSQAIPCLLTVKVVEKHRLGLNIS